MNRDKMTIIIQCTSCNKCLDRKGCWNSHEHKLVQKSCYLLYKIDHTRGQLIFLSGWRMLEQLSVQVS